MRLILLAENPQLYSSTRILAEAKALGIKSETLNPYQHDLLISSSSAMKKQEIICLHRSTGIRFDDFDLAIAFALEAQGATVVNPLNTLKLLRSKLLQHQFFAATQLPALPTYALRGKIEQSSLEGVADDFAKIAGTEKYIVKTERGNKGIGVNLLESKKSLLGFMETLWGMQDQRFILQPYMPGDEYRVLIIDGKIEGVILKQSDDSQYRKNANRATGQLIDHTSVPKNVLETALLCYQKAQALVAGIDIIVNQHGHYILECNLVPGFELMENKSGQNHAKQIIQAAIRYHQEKKNENRT